MPQPINISASRGASILGLSSYKTPVQTWLEIMESREPGFCEKHKFEMPEFQENAALKWGLAFEDAIIELAERKQNLRIIDREKLHQLGDGLNTKKDWSFITCHIDGRFEATTFLHEAKTTSFFYWNDNFGEPGTDRVPIDYAIQCQHQMICTGAEKVILSVLVFPKRVEEWEDMGWEIYLDDLMQSYYLRKEKIDHQPKQWANILDEMGYFHQYEIQAHPELQQRMIKHYTDFWNNHVLTGKEPEPQNYDDIKALCTEPVGTVLANEEIERLVTQYRDIKKEIGGASDLSVQADNIKIMILNYMRQAGVVEDDDSKDKWILRGQDGKKLASYGKDKRGYFIFR